MTTRSAFVEELGKVTRTWRNRFDAALKQTGLTFGRFTVLRQLARETSSVNQSVLAAHVGIECPTLVKLLDGLAEQSLVVRRPDSGDRRANQIELTARGRRLVAEVESLADSVRDRALAGLGDADLRAALRVLKAISENIEAESATAPA